jgi:hypothetical protein
MPVGLRPVKESHPSNFYQPTTGPIGAISAFDPKREEKLIAYTLSLPLNKWAEQQSLIRQNLPALRPHLNLRPVPPQERQESPPRPPPSSRNNNNSKPVTVRRQKVEPLTWQQEENLIKLKKKEEKERAEKAVKNAEKAAKNVENARKYINAVRQRNFSKIKNEIDNHSSKMEEKFTQLKNSVAKLKPWLNFSSKRQIRAIEKAIEQAREKKKHSYQMLEKINKLLKNPHSNSRNTLRYLQNAEMALNQNRSYITFGWKMLSFHNVKNIEAKIERWKKNEEAAKKKMNYNASRMLHKEEANKYLSQLNEKIKKNKAATKIQSVFRGMKVRKNQEKAKAATKIQSVFRGMKVRKNQEKAKAATKIQSVFRSAKARRELINKAFPGSKNATMKNVFSSVMRERMARQPESVPRRSGVHTLSPMARQSEPNSRRYVLVVSK